MGTACLSGMAVALIVAIIAAGCTLGPGSPRISPGAPGPGRDAKTALTGSLDLTNQNSPEAAGFAGGISRTVLAPGERKIGLQSVAAGFDAPMMVVSPDDGSGRLFVVDQIGVIRIIRADGTLAPEPFLDLRDRMVPLSSLYDERGLLSLAFHPDFRNDSRVYVYYSAPLRPGAPSGWSCTNRLSEFRVSPADPDKIDAGTEKILLTVDKPYENHNGGPVLFGPDDGDLYLALGDGGNADDVGAGHTPGTGNGQDLTTLLGKIIRIDVDHVPPGANYGIPAGNPFAGNGSARPEIFAYGFRNPAYATFDSGDGHRLFVANAGQALFESVYIVLKGEDYGWNIREGTHCFDPGRDAAPPAGPCPATGYHGEPLIGPVVELGHDVGNTVIGGVLYRGTALAGWQGSFVFGTWSLGFAPGDGTLLVATPPPGNDSVPFPSSASGLTAGRNRMWTTQEIAVANNGSGRVNAFVRAISEGPDHELYVLTSRNSGPGGPSQGSGGIWKVVPG
ncbi:MAG TPA: PQQ-dependent sugar dehydrogenase [Methanoregula sp.]|nr:PQQ-dependent sugar dehydrogenase [Methanoregula sp.]